MGILTLLRNAFGRSRKERATEAEGAERTPSQEQPTAVEPDAKVPSPSTEPDLTSTPAPSPAATTQVPEPRPSSTLEEDEHDLVALAFDNVTVPKPATSEEGSEGTGAVGGSAAADAPSAEVVAEPVAEVAAEPVAEVAVEPTTEVAAEPVADVVVEPVAETVAEAAVETEPVGEVKADAVVEAEAEAEPSAEVTPEAEVEPVAAVEAETEPAAEVTPEVEAEPVAEPAAEVTSEAEAEPVAEAAPEAEQAVEPETEPEAKAEAEPVVEPESVVEPVVEPAGDADSAPEAEPTVEPVAESTSEPEAEAEPVAAEVAEPVVDEMAEPVAAEVTAVPEPVAAEVPEPVAEPIAAVAADGETVTGDGGDEDLTAEVVGTGSAAVAIGKAGLTGTTAKLYLVLDRSASMRPYYKDGSAQALADQTLALATHLDPDPTPTVHVVFFSTEVDGTTDLTAASPENAIDEAHAGLGRMGRTSYHAAVEAVLAHYDANATPGTPALVVFQTDGAPDAKTPATQSLTDAAKSHASVFFSFVAFGDHENKAFDYLRKLKTDNTAFFHAGPTPLELTDAELYDGVLIDWRP
ncbi:VWA domain-containing protein [Streptomyces sp. MBT65]|uniref:VWA domain-containing protein n=1 Tax=Streptomyces sp. MBT65 TaxID=1488395 RepID=UPI00190DC3D3|nr:VWA domain-containing protein [Streptomyces sp. MBT65]MBK3576743.1 VWA domain-containing protein [Streptomyces sp. MBT65]